MLAYHNDPQLKQQILQQLQIHHDADEIIKGIYWENGKGCAVGCTLHSRNHQEYETRFGIPEVLAHLEDAIFNGLLNCLAKQWPIRFMSAIPVGADLSHVWRDFAVWLLIDPVDGVIKHTNPGTEAYEVILRVANLYQHGYTAQQMIDAAAAAYAAYDYNAAAYNDAAANAAYAAYNAAANANAAASAAASAAADANAAASASVAYAYDAFSYASAYAYDAAASAAYAAYNAAANAANAEFYTKMSNKLIELLENTDKTRTENVSLS